MRFVFKISTLGLMAAVLGACAQNPDPALRPSKGDLFQTTADAMTLEPSTVRTSGLKLANHATEVIRGTYVDWCPMYRLGCPRPPSATRRPVVRLY